MITGIQLENFKAHSSLRIDNLAPISIIVGPNNIGKSAILQALAIPSYGLISTPEIPIGSRVTVPKVGSQSATVRIWLEGGSAPLEYIVQTTDLTSNPTFQSNNQIFPVWQPNVIVGGVVRSYPGLYFRQDASPFPPRIGGFPKLDLVRYLSALRGLPESFAHAPIDAEVGPRGENTGNILHNLISSRDLRFGEVERWAKDLGLRISTISSQTIDTGRGITWYSVGDAKTESTFVGSGTLAVIPILVQGVLCTAGQALLIEEPESHLHRGAMNGLWRFFEDCTTRGVQIIASSHSFDLLKALYRRSQTGEVKGDKVRVYSLTPGLGGSTVVETYPPDKIVEYEDRIVRQLSEA